MEEDEMNKLNNNLQDVFLNQSRKGHIPVTIHLTNGFQLKGQVKGFDNFTIILDCEGKQVLIYKHAVSTISPLKPILFTTAPEKTEIEE
jgi:host factor-I protein